MQNSSDALGSELCCMALRRSFSSEQVWGMSSFSAAAKLIHATLATYKSRVNLGLLDAPAAR